MESKSFTNQITSINVPSRLSRLGYRFLLTSLRNKQVEVSTPFETYRGNLTAVQLDYVVLTESDGSIVFIRIAKIETVIGL
ncbi:DUF2642 domain-containing protein [Priestia sp. D3YE.R1]|uniref:DUF2642 domain-containing protein n=1 Tax=Priestia sp. D3YE.R1 TaxID=3400416 RepID=UPI003BA37314